MGLTLREGNREYFYTQLDELFPGLSECYRRTYGDRYEVTSPHNDRLMRLFHAQCEAAGILHNNNAILQYLHEYETPLSCGRLRRRSRRVRLRRTALRAAPLFLLEL